jgi:SAM-dependent methyltransferase
MRLASRLPEPLKGILRPARTALQNLACRGRGRRCPVCGKSSRRFRAWGAWGLAPRREAICIHCGSLERHRLAWLFMRDRTDLLDGRPKKVLHVAPEPCIEARLRELLGEGYLTADLSNPRAMVKLDVTSIPYPDRSFDAIYCSHVLEHVPDDRRAMRELHRVLKDDGWAILLVPINSDRTIEDPAIVDPKERLRVFGQEDHVRRYGPDYVDRLREAGFAVEVTTIRDLVDDRRAMEMGLSPAGGEIHYCTKRERG